MEHIGIIIESENNAIKRANYGMITLARQQDASLTAFVVNTDADSLKADLAGYGITKIVSMSITEEGTAALNPELLSNMLVQAVEEYKVTSVFGLSTAFGRNLMPRMAASLDAPLVMDCTDVDLNQKVAVTSQYSGKTLAKIKLSGGTCLYGIRPRAVEPKPALAEARIEKFNVKNLGTRAIKVLPTEGKQRADHDRQGLALGDADIIIAGGRGMKNAQNFNVLFECADKLNAAVGASRVAVDSGWVPYAMQVGQTGEKVSPKVYIACGISGSIQHFAGMKTSGLVVAINTDENAAMMSNADYIVKGELLDIVPEITKLLEDE